MKIEQRHWRTSCGWDAPVPGELGAPAHLVLLFGSRSAPGEPGGPGGGEAGLSRRPLAGLLDRRGDPGDPGGRRLLVLTAIRFDATAVEGACSRIDHVEESRSVGLALSRALNKEGLVHVMVLSDGLKVNGTALVAGLLEGLPADVTVTGGLSADGDRFEETLVLWDEKLEPGMVAAVGLLRQPPQGRLWLPRRLGSLRARAPDHALQGQRAL